MFPTHQFLWTFVFTLVGAAIGLCVGIAFDAEGTPKNGIQEVEYVMRLATYTIFGGIIGAGFGFFVGFCRQARRDLTPSPRTASENHNRWSMGSMDTESYCNLIAERFYPQPYTDRVETPTAAFRLLLTFKKWWSARYALAVSSWDTSLDGRSFLTAKRREVARNLSATWPFRAVALYLIVCGSKDDWGRHVDQMRADATGLHAVTVQAVHFVDLETGESALNQSSWLARTISGVDSVASVVNSIIDD